MANKFSQLVIDYVVEYYPFTRTSEMALVLGLTEAQIYRIAESRGIKKDKAYLSETHGPLVIEVGKNSRFKKGMTPWNKGVKGRNNAPEHTLFKKGHVPKNYKPVGWTRIDAEGYTWMKIKEGRNGWAMIHRIAWELENGPLPKGKFLRFIDGNKANWDLSNLMLVDREENMKLNTIHRYPEDVKDAMKALSKLKRKIETHGKEQN